MSLLDYEPAVRFLRRAGCRCTLMWDAVLREPRPFTRCEVPACNDRTRCWYIDSLKFARQREFVDMVEKTD